MADSHRENLAARSEASNERRDSVPTRSDLIETLRGLLRRDPHDREVSFLISVAVREPFVVYDGERRLLERMLGYAGSERAIAAAARALLR